ncbi:MAG: homoserine kinase, partial [Fidelibacterota bacterium]
MGARYRTSVPATTANLGPGYDILGLALDLYLVATAIPAEEWFFELRGEGRHLLDTCDMNLMARAFRESCDRYGWEVQPLRVESDNPIPLARGLGSSAAAIVTGMALAQLVNRGSIDKDALFRDAAELEGHPDNVAAAVYGGLQEVMR